MMPTECAALLCEETHWRVGGDRSCWWIGALGIYGRGPLPAWGEHVAQNVVADKKIKRRQLDQVASWLALPPLTVADTTPFDLRAMLRSEISPRRNWGQPVWLAFAGRRILVRSDCDLSSRCFMIDGTRLWRMLRGFKAR